MRTREINAGLEIRGAVTGEQREIVSEAALEFIARLHREFNPRRVELLKERQRRREMLDRRETPHFPKETAHVRDGDWQVLPVPEELRGRRVEITGPVDRKMVINALNSGANCYMADFEDSLPPPGKARWMARLTSGMPCVD